MQLLLAVLLSFVPAFLCAAFVYWIDRYEKEPKLLLGFVFFWGAVVAENLREEMRRLAPLAMA